MPLAATPEHACNGKLHPDRQAGIAQPNPALLNLAPTHGNTHQDIETRICKADGYQDLRRGLSPAAKSLILGLLTQEPMRRMTSADVLSHGWLLRRSPVPLPAPTARGAVVVVVVVVVVVGRAAWLVV